MITVALSTTIGAPRDRVWRALVDLDERTAWDERILGRVVSRDPCGSRGRSASRGRSRTAQAGEALAGGAALTTAAAATTAAATTVAPCEPLRRTRWRFVLGNVPMVLREEVLSAQGHDRIVSRVTIGSMHFDQTLTFHPEAEPEAEPESEEPDAKTGLASHEGDGDIRDARTRLGMKVVAHNSIAVIGELVPRLDVQRLVIEYVDTTLRQIQKYCESEA